MCALRQLVVPGKLGFCAEPDSLTRSRLAFRNRVRESASVTETDLVGLNTAAGEC